ncbi:MAG: FtsK/SpoIIIE domain-containing protein [Pseudomonadota bacterium]
MIKRPEVMGRPGPLAFPLGVGLSNEVIMADLADANMCHALIGGTSGSGKSELLKALVASLVSRNRVGELVLTIVDPKILTFAALNGSPFLSGPVITEVGEAVNRLKSAVVEMDRRYKQLDREGFENLSARFASGRADVPFLVIIFDEFSDLVLAGKEEKKEFERLAKRLAAKGRAAGVHLVLSTQRPDREVVTPLIKANLPLKICLRVTSGANSKIILDQTGGETLFGRGDFLCDQGRGLVRGQALLVSPDDLNRVARGG